MDNEYHTAPIGNKFIVVDPAGKRVDTYTPNPIGLGVVPRGGKDNGLPEWLV